MKILKAVVLAEFDDNKVRQVIVDEKMIIKFLTGIAYLEGSLKVLEAPIEGITLERNINITKNETTINNSKSVRVSG